MRVLVAVLATILLTGCSTTAAGTANSAPRLGVSSPAAPATPPESPAHAPVAYAVMVHRAGVGDPYIVQLVGPDNSGGPTVHPISRSDKTFYFSSPCPSSSMCSDAETAAYAMPETSISSTRVYFLDGETQVRALAPDGTVTEVKDIQAPPNSDVMFAVSPDDSRMAVAVITLATTAHPTRSFSEHMYVEDLASTSHRVDLYSSTVQPEWPVAWREGSLVVAVAGPDMWADSTNPYGAKGYVVLDPATGAVLVTLGCAFGQLTPVGSVCVDGGCPTTTTCKPAAVSVQWWDGRTVPMPLPAQAAYVFTAWNYTQLSPDGSLLAVDAVTDPTSGSTKTVVSRLGDVVFTTLAGAPQGWLDSAHLVVSNAGAVYIDDVITGDQVQMTDLQTIPTQGMPSFTGVLPFSLG